MHWMSSQKQRTSNTLNFHEQARSVAHFFRCLNIKCAYSIIHCDELQLGDIVIGASDVDDHSDSTKMWLINKGGGWTSISGSIDCQFDTTFRVVFVTKIDIESFHALVDCSERLFVFSSSPKLSFVILRPASDV